MYLFHLKDYAMEIKKIAFLDVYPIDDSVIMGAVMVTDADTKPLEFRVTSPVKPTNFQKILYGNVLKEHILVELLAVPLINALNEELDLIVVNDGLFLGVNNKQDIRVVRVFNGTGISDEQNVSIELTPDNNGNGKYNLELLPELEQELAGQYQKVLKVLLLHVICLNHSTG
jgi:hypothetical protein